MLFGFTPQDALALKKDADEFEVDETVLFALEKDFDSGTVAPVNDHVQNEVVLDPRFCSEPVGANGNCVGCDDPVVTSPYDGYGAPGYSNPSVQVTSHTSHSISVRGTCIITIAYTNHPMSGTRTISV
ncbi:MAG: hypothetical protein QM302_01275 [Acidobacteriota bacterium]|nr:hypothetical protein [Acidobacteriota bacterium]